MPEHPDAWMGHVIQVRCPSLGNSCPCPAIAPVFWPMAHDERLEEAQLGPPQRVPATPR